MIGVKHVEDDVHQLWVKLVSCDHAARPLQHNNSSNRLPYKILEGVISQSMTKKDLDLKLELCSLPPALRMPSNASRAQRSMSLTDKPLEGPLCAQSPDDIAAAGGCASQTHQSRPLTTYKK